MNRVRMVHIVNLVLLFAASSLFGQLSNSDNSQPLELGSALQEVRDKLPKWRATLSAVDVESLPIQYKTGKQVELLKSVALEQLNRIDKTSIVLAKAVTAMESAQLLLDMQDAGAAADQLASALMLMSTVDQKPASSWDRPVLDLSTDMMATEKRTEVPVMKLLAARDALLDLCKAKLVP